MYQEFSWREKRLYSKFQRGLPRFINTEMTSLPTGNAHYSMYGLRESDMEAYLNLCTKKHKIYEHYSDELIIDAETADALAFVLDVCNTQGWSYSLYTTGSREGGGHVSIPRIAEPSEILYLKDLSIIFKFFHNVSDIDYGIYTPMHLIRGIGKIHEKTGETKILTKCIKGITILSVNDVEIGSLLLTKHNKTKLDFKQAINTDWRKLQSTMMRHDPTGISHGGRHIAVLCFAKDLFKCGLSYIIVRSMVENFNNEFEEPKSDEGIETAIRQAQRSVYGCEQ